MRPDWEAVITPFVDYAVTRGEIAADKIVLFGYSLGGYLVARAAAFAGNLPPFIASWIDEGRDDVAVPVLTMIAAVNIRLRWGLRNVRWLFGADSFADLIRKSRDHTLNGIADQIAAPTP